MSFTIELHNGGYGMSGWGGRDQRAVEKHLPELAVRARDDAKRSGRPLSAYRITVIEHARRCPGCPTDLGLDPECRDVAEYRADRV